MTFGQAGRSQCRACRWRQSPHKIKAGETATCENAQRKAVGDIAVTDFPMHGEHMPCYLAAFPDKVLR